MPLNHPGCAPACCHAIEIAPPNKALLRAALRLDATPLRYVSRRKSGDIDFCDIDITDGALRYLLLEVLGINWFYVNSLFKTTENFNFKSPRERHLIFIWKGRELN